jgi:hypothetical protein
MLLRFNVDYRFHGPVVFAVIPDPANMIDHQVMSQFET